MEFVIFANFYTLDITNVLELKLILNHKSLLFVTMNLVFTEISAQFET